jgi:SynChlorMet cassette radical SAM/SPASM protein ScmE
MGLDRPEKGGALKVFSAPQKVTLNLTNRCNLSCLYCGVSSTKNEPGDLSLEEWKSVIDELARIKVFHLLLSGGEPFTRPDLLQMLEHISAYPFRISINTNGTLFDEEVLSFLSVFKRLDDVQVSLDGAMPVVHDRIRGKGSFERSMEGVRQLERRHIPFGFFVVVCRNNKDHLEEILKLSAALGASRVTFSSLLPQGSALSHWGELSLSHEEQKRVEGDLRRLKREYPRLVGGSLVQTIEWMDQISEMDIPGGPAGAASRITSCGGSLRECSVRPDGWVIPCDRLWNYTAGNVRDTPFQAIWLHSEAFRDFRMRYDRSMEFYEECRDCRFLGVCRGGCPAVPYNTGRGIQGWDPLSCYKVFVGQKASYV